MAFKDDLIERARQVPGQALAGLDSADQDKLFHIIGKMINNLRIDKD